MLAFLKAYVHWSMCVRLGLGHETMVCAVCLSIFLCNLLDRPINHNHIKSYFYYYLVISIIYIIKKYFFALNNMQHHPHTFPFELTAIVTINVMTCTTGHYFKEFGYFCFENGLKGLIFFKFRDLFIYISIWCYLWTYNQAICVNLR